MASASFQFGIPPSRTAGVPDAGRDAGPRWVHESGLDAAIVQAALRARGTLHGVHPSLLDDVRARLPRRAYVLPEGTVWLGCGDSGHGCGGSGGGGPMQQQEYDAAELDAVVAAALAVCARTPVC
jgi:hypothetical protein